MRKLDRGWLIACALCACGEVHGPDSAADAGAGANAGIGADLGGQPELVQDSLAFAIGGRRLRARYFVAGTAEQFRTMYDSALGFACELVPDVTGDGMHCVPREVSDAIFLDSACTEPIVALQANDASQTPDWISVLSSDAVPSCMGEPEAPRKVYRLGDSVFTGGLDAIGMTLPPVYAQHAGDCTSTEVQSGLLLPSLYRLQPQDLQQLVAGTVSTLEVGGGLSIRRVVAEDGAEITLEVLGREGQWCGLQRDGRCLPPVANEQGGFYLDGACATAAFFAPSDFGCSAPSIGMREVADVVRVFELVPVSDAYIQNVIADPAAAPGSELAFSCDAFTDTSSLFAAGDEITSSFSKANPLLTGEGPLHMTRFVAENPTGVRDDRVVFLDGGGEFVDDDSRRCFVASEPEADGTYPCSTDYVVVDEPRVVLGAVELVER